MKLTISTLAAATSCLLAAASAQLAVAPPARADTSFTCTSQINTLPFVISAPGHFCMSGGWIRHAAPAGGAAITINASNVIVDCNGGSIYDSGGAAGTRGVFFGTRNDIEVRNCNLHGFAQGIVGGGSNQRVFVHDNTVADSRGIPIQLAVSNGAVSRNRIIDTVGASVGIYVTVGPNAVAGVNSNLIRNMSGPATSMDAIWIYGTGRADVTENVISAIGTGTTTIASAVRIGSTVASVPANITDNHLYNPTAVKSYPVLKSAASAKSRCDNNITAGTWQASTGCL